MQFKVYQNNELIFLVVLTLIRLSMANLPFKPNSRLIFLQKKDICRFRLIQSTYFFLKRQILYFLFFDFKFNQLRSMGTTEKKIKKTESVVLGLSKRCLLYFFLIFLSLTIRRFQKLKKETKNKVNVV